MYTRGSEKPCKSIRSLRRGWTPPQEALHYYSSRNLCFAISKAWRSALQSVFLYDPEFCSCSYGEIPFILLGNFLECIQHFFRYCHSTTIYQEQAKGIPKEGDDCLHISVIQGHKALLGYGSKPPRHPSRIPRVSDSSSSATMTQLLTKANWIPPTPPTSLLPHSSQSDLGPQLPCINAHNSPIPGLPTSALPSLDLLVPLRLWKEKSDYLTLRLILLRSLPFVASTWNGS